MTSIAKYTEDAKAVIEKIKYITLATVSEDGTPWNSPLLYARDDDYNLYLYSPKNTQHAQNIRTNRRGFVSIYDSTSPLGEGFGVYMIVDVKELNSREELQKAIEAYLSMEEKQKEPKDFVGGAALRFYKITPKILSPESGPGFLSGKQSAGL